MTRAAVALAAALVLAPTLAFARGGKDAPKGGPAKPAVPIQLKGAPIRDLPTTVSVPLNDELSLVLPLQARFWIQTPRHLPVPTSLDGRGMIVQYLNARGGSVTMMYVGCVPLGGSFPDDAPNARAQRAASDFVTALAAKYERVDWVLENPPITLTETSIKVAGKKTAAWRTSRVTTHPGEYGGPDSVFYGAGILFQPPGTDVLAYVFLDAKGGGTTLDAAIEKMDVKPTRGLHAAPRRVQTNNLYVSADGRFPVRLLAFEMPAGFVPTPALDAVKGEWMYVEERLPATGPTDAELKIAQRPAENGLDAKQVADQLHGLWSEAERTPLETVELATSGHVAYLFAHPAPRIDANAREFSAVWLLDDQILTLTWLCRGGPAQEAKDRPLVVALLKSVEMAVRW